MPIKFNCHKCGAKLRVPEQHIGKKARCPKCDEKCVVPETSQRDPGSDLGSNFDDLGSFLDQPSPAAVGLPPAVASPVSPPPAMATPIGTPLPSSVPPAMAQSPYATPMARKHSGGGSGGVMHPLYEARTMMKIWGWMTFIMGILYCITIFYAIFGWVFVWMGWLVKGAAEAITVGVETGDQSQLELASQRLATFFRILGVLAIISLSLIALGLVLGIVALVISLVANV